MILSKNYGLTVAAVTYFTCSQWQSVMGASKSSIIVRRSVFEE